MKIKISQICNLLVLLLISFNSCDIPTQNINENINSEIKVSEKKCFTISPDIVSVEFDFIPQKTGYYHISNEEQTYTPGFSPKVSTIYESTWLQSSSDESKAINSNVLLEQGKLYKIIASGSNTSVAINCCVEVVLDMDDSRDLSTAISDRNSPQIILSGEIDNPKDKDVYTLTAWDDCYAHITCQDINTPSDFNPKISIYNDANQQIGTDSKIDKAVIGNVSLKAGKNYKIYVESKNAIKGSYTLTCQRDKDDLWNLLESNPNNEMNIYNGKIDNQYDEDKFYFDNHYADGNYHIIVIDNYLPSNFNPKVQIINRETNAYLSSSSGVDSALIVNIKLQKETRYYINVIDNNQNNITGEYTLRISRDYDDDSHIWANLFEINGKIDFISDVDEITYTPIGTNDKITIESSLPSQYLKFDLIDTDYNKYLSYKKTTETNKCIFQFSNIDPKKNYKIRISYSNNLWGTYKVSLSN